MKATAHDLRVGGLAPLSTCDWPDRLVATVFAAGCGWRCAYCHNRALRAPRARHAWADVEALLQRRRGLLDGVVFSGGEATRQPALPYAVQACRDLGFGIGLHTNGEDPTALAAVLPHVDWVGLDIKAPPRLYPKVTGRGGSAEAAWASLRLVVERSVAHEVRITLDPCLDDAALLELASALGAEGAAAVALQSLRDPVDARVRRDSRSVAAAVVERFRSAVPVVSLR